jgi:DivIVA domain-containing protein
MPVWDTGPMELTSEEVNDKQFHDAWRGYNQGEVDDFLDRVGETIDRLQRENADLTTRVAELDQAVAASRETEEMLKKTLVTAQQAAEEAIAKARAQAQELINEAEARVRSSESEVRERLDHAEAEARRRAADSERDLSMKQRESEERIAGLRAMESNVKRRLHAFLEQQLRALEALEADVTPPATRPAGAARGSEEQAEPGAGGRGAVRAEPGAEPGAVRAEPQTPPRVAPPAAQPANVRRREPEPATPVGDAGGSAPDAPPTSGPEDVGSRQRGLRDFLRKQG